MATDDENHLSEVGMDIVALTGILWLEFLVGVEYCVLRVMR